MKAWVFKQRAALSSACMVATLALGQVFGAAPALAADNGNIIFYRAAGLLRTNTTGTFTATLTNPPPGYTDEAASWSRNGQHVAFLRRPGARDQWQRDVSSFVVMLVDRYGQRERSLIRAWSPTWSTPPVNRIAFLTGTRDSSCISVINPDGTGLQRLGCIRDVIGPGYYLCQEFVTCYPEYEQLAWSRDGRYIISRVITELSSPTSLRWTYSLWRMDVSTGQQVQIPGTPDNEAEMAISVGPGTSLYYDTPTEYNPTTGVTSSIYKVDFLSGSPVRITDGFAPMVSPDGRKLAFTRPTTVPISGTNRYSRLYVANADGTAQRRLTNPLANVQFIPLDWSADSGRILLQRLAPDRSSLHLVSTTGTWVTVRSNGHAEAGSWYQPLAAP